MLRVFELASGVAGEKHGRIARSVQGALRFAAKHAWQFCDKNAMPCWLLFQLKGVPVRIENLTRDSELLEMIKDALETNPYFEVNNERATAPKNCFVLLTMAGELAHLARELVCDTLKAKFEMELKEISSN